MIAAKIFMSLVLLYIVGFTACVHAYSSNHIAPNCTRILLTLIPIVHWIKAIRLFVDLNKKNESTYNDYQGLD